MGDWQSCASCAYSELCPDYTRRTMNGNCSAYYPKKDAESVRSRAKGPDDELRAGLERFTEESKKDAFGQWERSGHTVHRFMREIAFIDLVVREYAAYFDVSVDRMFAAFEKDRTYWWPNYYQRSNLPETSRLYSSETGRYCGPLYPHRDKFERTKPGEELSAAAKRLFLGRRTILLRMSRYDELTYGYSYRGVYRAKWPLLGHLGLGGDFNIRLNKDGTGTMLRKGWPGCGKVYPGFQWKSAEE